VRVAGVALALRAADRSVVLPPLVDAWPAFTCDRGADMRVDLTYDAPPAVSVDDRLFDSTGVWQLFRHQGGVLYALHTPDSPHPFYKALAMDAALSCGTLYWPRPHVGRHPLEYPLDELIFQHRLVRDGALEIHACTLVIGGRAWLFCGQSGAGKTTTARLWRRLRPKTPILTDDRVVLRPRGGRVWAHGTPWHGTGGFHSASGVPLGAICFLEQAETTLLVLIHGAEAVARLFARSFPPPWEAAGLAAALALCERTVGEVPCFRLPFRKDASAVAVVSAQAEALGARGAR